MRRALLLAALLPFLIGGSTEFIGGGSGKLKSADDVEIPGAAPGSVLKDVNGNANWTIEPDKGEITSRDQISISDGLVGQGLFKLADGTVDWKNRIETEDFTQRSTLVLGFAFEDSDCVEDLPSGTPYDFGTTGSPVFEVGGPAHAPGDNVVMRVTNTGTQDGCGDADDAAQDDLDGPILACTMYLRSDSATDNMRFVDNGSGGGGGFPGDTRLDAGSTNVFEGFVSDGSSSPGFNTANDVFTDGQYFALGYQLGNGVCTGGGDGTDGDYCCDNTPCTGTCDLSALPSGYGCGDVELFIDGVDACTGGSCPTGALNVNASLAYELGFGSGGASTAGFEGVIDEHYCWSEIMTEAEFCAMHRTNADGKWGDLGFDCMVP